MSTRPSVPTQLQLPLDRPSPSRSRSHPRSQPTGRRRASGRSDQPSPATPTRTDGGDQGRLDEQTRQIGRQGIAAARARLATTSGHPVDRAGGERAAEALGGRDRLPEDHGRSGHAA